MSDDVRLYEVGPRDGLQSLPTPVPTEDKVALIDALSACGYRHVEAAAFVSARAVPQMADGAAVMARIARADAVAYAALTPNRRGVDAALEAGADEVAIFAAASEGFSRANLNADVDAAFDRFAAVAEAAAAAGVRLRAYLSCVIGCPFDGPTPPATVARLVERLLRLGAYAVSLGDTIGVGDRASVRAMLAAALDVAGPHALAGHFHDTGGGAIACVETALDHDLRVFDVSVAGLGGCPFAPGAPGNVDARAVAERLTALGLRHGLDLDRLAAAETVARRLAQAARARGPAAEGSP